MLWARSAVDHDAILGQPGFVVAWLADAFGQQRGLRRVGDGAAIAGLGGSLHALALVRVDKWFGQGLGRAQPATAARAGVAARRWAGNTKPRALGHAGRTGFARRIVRRGTHCHGVARALAQPRFFYPQVMP